MCGTLDRVNNHFACLNGELQCESFLACRVASSGDLIEGHVTKVAGIIMEKGYQLFMLVCHSHLLNKYF